MKAKILLALLATVTPARNCQGPTSTEAESACAECPPLPDTQTATFLLGEPEFLGDSKFKVGVLVNTSDDVNFSQFTLDYHSECLELLDVELGSSVPPNANLVVNADDGTDFDISTKDADRHVLVQVTDPVGSYTGCANQIALLEFQFNGTLTTNCFLEWDQSSPSNPPTQLITTDPFQVRPPDIEFCRLELNSCRLAQLAAQMLDRNDFRNNGDYISAVASLLNGFKKNGDIDGECVGCIISQFARRVPADRQTVCPR